jgi:adenine-specific DNA-methyltransferase
MVRARKRTEKPASSKRRIEQYDHKSQRRKNNPPVGLVTEATDHDAPKQRYEYDPHLDPTLTWAGKAEHLSFDVPTVSLHVHERIDPKSIMDAVRRRNGTPAPVQGSLFESPEENPPLREAIDFYQHAHAWSNRLIAGDSLLVMNSLLEKEGMAGKVQMVYIDPPYGIRYGSNFQPFVNKRDVKDGSDEDLTQEPEMIRAFRDTWELGIHSYLTYLRDRLLLARELLHESGSCFVQISDENVHLVRNLMDEVFDSKNIVALITFLKTTGATVNFLPGTCDYLIWYAKDQSKAKFRSLFLNKTVGGAGATGYNRVRLPDGKRRQLSGEELASPNLLPQGSRIYTLDNLTSQSEGREKGEGAACWFPVTLDGKTFRPSHQARWKTNERGIESLKAANRLEPAGDTLRYVRFLDDFAVYPITNVWADTTIAGYAADKVYVVQTTSKVVARCLLMTTDPGDLVFDPTCGSGTTAYVAEQWGRRWITCDTSRVATTLAKQRLMTAVFDYYELAHPAEGVGSGFVYKTVPHVTLKSIANNEPPGQETLYDQPKVDGSRVRVTGPFTVEAVPAPTVRPLTGVAEPQRADASVARSGETLRQAEWRAELLKTGIRGKNNQMIVFSRVEPLAATRWLHADAESLSNDRGADRVSEPRPSAERVVISFGPEHAPLGGVGRGSVRRSRGRRASTWRCAACRPTRRQVFFPMADESGGWARLARNLKAEIDLERIEAYRGSVSLPFEPGAHKRVAVKIVDDRGIESLKIIPTP